MGYGEFKPLRDIAVPQFYIPENPHRRVTAYPGTIPAQPGTIPAESGEMTGELGQSRPKMEQKERKIRSGTPPGLPKSVRDASGAPPDDENAADDQKRRKK